MASARCGTGSVGRFYERERELWINLEKRQQIQHPCIPELLVVVRQGPKASEAPTPQRGRFARTQTSFHGSD